MSSVCRFCLAGNTKLYSLESNLLIDFYEKQSSTKFYAEDAKPRALCCICYLKLQKCLTFFQMADRSDKIFTQLYDKGLKATHEYITEVNLRLKPQLTMTTVQTMVLDGITTNAGSQEIIKCEPVPIIDIKEEITTGQDEWVEVKSVLEDFPKSHIKSENNSDQGEYLNDLEELSLIIEEETKPDDSKMTRMNTHTREKTFACNECDKKFKRNYNLVSHMKTHIKKKQFSCNVCHKQCISKQHLVIHMRNHTGEKPFVCNVCDKRFKQTPHLVSHMRIHTGEKPFACNVCEKQFSHKKSLDFHMRSHTGAQPFVCNVCKKQYKLKSDLVRHMRNHSGGMPFACNVCDKRFNLNRDLVRHMRVHTGEMPFACNLCDKTFRVKCNLKTHIKTHK